MITPTLEQILAQIDAARIMSQVEQIAQIGRLATGGVTRLAFSREDQAARNLLREFMQEAGLEVSRDAVGNIIGRLQSSEPGRPIAATGSHIDTVINGGKFDGVLGVLTAVECARLIRQNARLRSSIEVICFVMEESSRFGAGYGFGSRVMAGRSIADAELRVQDACGKTLAQAVQELRAWEAARPPDLPDERAALAETRKNILASRRDWSRIGAFVELHVEQGPVLEKAAKSIGIVTRVAAPTRLDVTFVGEQGHSGTTPMHLRRDALAAAAQAILCVEQICQQSADEGIVGTVGVIQAQPGAMNVIPGQARIGVDVRGSEAEVKKGVVELICQELGAIGRKRSVQVQVRVLTEEQPVAFSPRVVEMLQEVCSELALPAMRLASGAGHDAAHVAEFAEAGMIFVPSAGGISHDPREFTGLNAIQAGAQALLATLLRLAS
jgi:hydantoinase/carbamoylase family amidase